jgi:hypothetical protein
MTGGKLAMAAVESGLDENFHYGYARRLGQLGALRVFAARNAEGSYLSACMARASAPGTQSLSLWTRATAGRQSSEDAS